MKKSLGTTDIIKHRKFLNHSRICLFPDSIWVVAYGIATINGRGDLLVDSEWSGSEKCRKHLNFFFDNKDYSVVSYTEREVSINICSEIKEGFSAKRTGEIELLKLELDLDSKWI